LDRYRYTEGTVQPFQIDDLSAAIRQAKRELRSDLPNYALAFREGRVARYRSNRNGMRRLTTRFRRSRR